MTIKPKALDYVSIEDYFIAQIWAIASVQPLIIAPEVRVIVY